MTITGGVFSADVSITMNNNVCEIKEFNNDVIKCMAPKSVSSLTLKKWYRIIYTMCGLDQLLICMSIMLLSQRHLLQYPPSDIS